MDNYEIIDSLSNISAFKTSQASELITKLKENLNLNLNVDKHLDIRKKISTIQYYADAQADSLITNDLQ